ncbi:MAG: hypothetical protein QF441_10730 [Bacteriovoracaceae bacterium]|jgi:type III secretory pathway component EscR|nr:hypothetical protein [Bacteriovoracaceae bacterium]
MKILILTVFLSSPTFAFDPQSLQKDLNRIQNEFLSDYKQKGSVALKKSLNKRRLHPTQETRKKTIEDLEAKYFDEINNRMAAPQKKKIKLRSR